MTPSITDYCFIFIRCFSSSFFWGAKTTIINRITSERIENERFSIFGWRFVNLRIAIAEAHICISEDSINRPGDSGSAIQSLRVLECYRHSMISGQALRHHSLFQQIHDNCHDFPLLSIAHFAAKFFSFPWCYAVYMYMRTYSNQMDNPF